VLLGGTQWVGARCRPPPPHTHYSFRGSPPSRAGAPRSEALRSAVERVVAERLAEEREGGAAAAATRRELRTLAERLDALQVRGPAGG